VTDRFHKALWHPIRTLQRHLQAWNERRHYSTPNGYHARDYWQARHTHYGFDLRGVGDRTKTEEENLRILRVGGDLILDLCRKHDVHLPTARVLDAGCGTGFYAGVLRSAGMTDYTGIDIVPTLFDGLRERFPTFRFRVTDLGERLIEGEFDLILLLDVVQHITDEHRFSFALRNLKLALAPDGILIISAPLGPYRRHSFYFVVRPLETFVRLFPGWSVDGPVPFEGNSMFVLRRINGR
jgi:SAM-dependent methyltransferase